MLACTVASTLISTKTRQSLSSK